MNAQYVLIKPVISEKSMLDAELGKFTFIVARYSTKNDIKKVLKKVFNVTPVSVTTSIVKGKTKRIGKKRTEVADSVWKKAIITLKKGEKISLFEPGGAAAQEEKKKK